MRNRHAFGDLEMSNMAMGITVASISRNATMSKGFLFKRNGPGLYRVTACQRAAECTK